MTGSKKIFDIYYNPTEVHSEFKQPGPDLIFRIPYDDLQLLFATSFFLFVILFTIGIQEIPLIRSVARYIPESALLLFMGIFLGGLAMAVKTYSSVPLPTIRLPYNIFRDVLIAPIILHSSYDIYHPKFFSEFKSIIIMAIVGTVLNVIGVAFFTRYIYAIHFQPHMTFGMCLNYGTIVSAVDPVAVLGIFNAVNADKSLYYLVFGEALLNDGVTFVLFESFKQVALIGPEDQLTGIAYVYMFASFLTAPLGGFLVGLVAALLSALFTRYSTPNSINLQTLIVTGMSAFSYLIALNVGFSGIISLITCGILQVRYAFPNLMKINQISLQFVIKKVSTIFEAIIFVILGCEVVSVNLMASWKFMLIILFNITFWRLFVVFGLANFINLFRNSSIKLKWQLVIFCGGLRGAFAFVMALEYDGPFRRLFQDATVFIIAVTTVIYGVLADPLVHCLKLIDKEHAEGRKELEMILTACADLTKKCMAKTAGAGQYRDWILKFKSFEKRFVTRYLCKSEQGRSQIIRMFEFSEQEMMVNLLGHRSLYTLVNDSRNKQRERRREQNNRRSPERPRSRASSLTEVRSHGGQRQ